MTAFGVPKTLTYGSEYLFYLCLPANCGIDNVNTDTAGWTSPSIMAYCSYPTLVSTIINSLQKEKDCLTRQSRIRTAYLLGYSSLTLRQRLGLQQGQARIYQGKLLSPRPFDWPEALERTSYNREVNVRLPHSNCPDPDTAANAHWLIINLASSENPNSDR